MAYDWRRAYNLRRPEWLFIYALLDPKTEEVCYVGKTNNPQKRLDLHLSGARHGKGYPSALWIQNLLARGTPPVLVVLEVVSYHDAQERERWWIRHAKEHGCPLTNVKSGGGGPT